MFGLEKTAARMILGLSIVALLVGLFALHSCQTARTAKTGEKLATGQRGAAIESGSDAVQTIGNAMVNEAEIQTTVKDGTDAINAAPAGNSNDAADRATCRLRSYRHSGKCVALLGPTS